MGEVLVHLINLTNWRQRGFTLIEVMVVVVIIAILAAIIVPNVMKKPDQVKQVAVQQGILSIQNPLDLYKLDNSAYFDVKDHY